MLGLFASGTLVLKELRAMLFSRPIFPPIATILPLTFELTKTLPPRTRASPDIWAFIRRLPVAAVMLMTGAFIETSLS
jgi:hypothetical protein